MHITDPIADMLTRIRNANSAKHETVDIPASNMKKAIAQILLDEGYIASYKVIEDEKQGVIRVTLKCRRYAKGNEGTRYCNRFNIKRYYDRQRSSQAKRWRRSISICLVRRCS